MTASSNSTSVDPIVSAYNSDYRSNGEAWFTQHSTAGKTSFDVVGKLSSWLNPKTREMVETAKKATEAFLQSASRQLNPTIASHKLMLDRIEHSFIHCEFSVDTVELTKLINAIRNKHTPKYEAGSTDPKVILQRHAPRFPKDRLCYSDEHYLLANLVFLVGKEQLPIPACRATLIERSPYWESLILPIVKQETPIAPCVTLGELDAASFIHLINIIHGKDDYPSDAYRLTLLAQLASRTGENAILETAVEKLKDELAKLSDAELFEQYKELDLNILPDQLRAPIVSRWVRLLWRKKPEELSLSQVHFLLQQDEAPMPEYQIFEYLEKWEDYHRSPNTPRGLLIKQLVDGKTCLLDQIRFEIMPRDIYVAKVMGKTYLSPGRRMQSLRELQKAQDPHSKLDLGSWKPRPARSIYEQSEDEQGS